MSDLPREEADALPVTDSQSVAARVPEPAPEPVLVGDSLFGRLRDLITAPSRLMDRVRVRPQWWVPGIIVLVVMAAFTWLTLPISGPEQMEMMRDSKLMSMVPEEQWQEQYDAALHASGAKRLLQSVQSGFGGWLMILIFGFILGFFARMSGGKGSFRQALGVTSWAALIPFALGPIVKAPLVLITESTYRVNLGLAALMPGGDPNSAAFQFLMMYGDFLTWWGLAVLVIGFSRVFGLSRNAAAVSVVLPWALLSLIPLGLAILFL